MIDPDAVSKERLPDAGTVPLVAAWGAVSGAMATLETDASSAPPPPVAMAATTAMAITAITMAPMTPTMETDTELTSPELP